MLDPKKPMTHVVWAQHYQGTRFREWVEIGKARVEIDGNGNATVHSFTNRIARGDNGYTGIFPIGVRPPDPQPHPRRPHTGDVGDEETA
jgi:hypothetical protein